MQANKKKVQDYSVKEQMELLTLRVDEIEETPDLDSTAARVWFTDGGVFRVPVRIMYKESFRTGLNPRLAGSYYSEKNEQMRFNLQFMGCDWMSSQKVSEDLEIIAMNIYARYLGNRRFAKFLKLTMQDRSTGNRKCSNCRYRMKLDLVDTNDKGMSEEIPNVSYCPVYDRIIDDEYRRQLRESEKEQSEHPDVDKPNGNKSYTESRKTIKQAFNRRMQRNNVEEDEAFGCPVHTYLTTSGDGENRDYINETPRGAYPMSEDYVITVSPLLEVDASDILEGRYEVRYSNDRNIENINKLLNMDDKEIEGIENVFDEESEQGGEGDDELSAYDIVPKSEIEELSKKEIIGKFRNLKEEGEIDDEEFNKVWEVI